MTTRWPFLVLAASPVLAAVVVASAEPAEIQDRCVYRDDRPELGIPFYSKQGDELALIGNLPAGHRLQVLEGGAEWSRVEYMVPGPDKAVSLYRGWVRSEYL